MNGDARILRPARFVGGLVLGVALAFAAAPVAQADTTPPPSGPNNFFDCLSAMFSDPALHAQYCGGNTIPANGTGLSIPFSSPTATCHDVGSLTRPVFGGAQIASLDDSNLLAAPAGTTLQMATSGCCVSMLTAPSFATAQFASLGSIGSEVRDMFATPPAGTTQTVAGSCCYGELTGPGFATAHFASLESLGSELSGLPKHNLLVAMPCPP